MTTLHMLGLPHTTTTRDVTVCAFTTKAVKFSKMMRALGYRTVLYWGERNDADCDEHVPIVTGAEQARWYGDGLEPNLLPTAATWDSDSAPWRTFNARAISEVSKRWQHGDILLLLGGDAQAPAAEGIAALVDGYLACEPAAGYAGWFLPFVCFESNAWRHHQYGARGIGEGRWYDTVIPNFFDPDEWPHEPSSGDYLLFVGRMTRDKGPHIAAEIAREAGMPVVFAGPGVTSSQPDRIECLHYGFDGDDMEYVGVVGVEERARLMAGARALICPTTYIEPFGAVAVEAQLCGTPAIATDWGAFTETVVDGVGGFRFRTLAEGVEAVACADDLDRNLIREQALARYSLDAVGPSYDRWFRQLLDIHIAGWYTPALANAA